MMYGLFFHTGNRGLPGGHGLQNGWNNQGYHCLTGEMIKGWESSNASVMLVFSVCVPISGQRVF